MKQPLYFIADPDRAPQYRLETRILDHNGNKIAEKRASSPEAQPHLEAMLTNYKKIKGLASLDKTIRPVPVSSRNAVITFPFIEGTSADRLILEALISKNHEAAINLVNKMIGAVASLPSTKCNPTKNSEFLAIFGDSFNQSLDCSTIGLIDLNLDNIIIDGQGKWHLIDYEWVFDFPVPKIYLIQRYLYYFTIRHQENFKYHARRLPALALSPELIVPKVFYEAFSKYFKNLELIENTEACFQQHVMSAWAKVRVKHVFHETPTGYKPQEIGIDKVYISRGDKARMERQIESLNERLRVMEKSRNDILQSKTYRLARKLARIKNLGR